MDNFTAAKTSAETDGTERSVKFRKSLRRFIIGFTAIILIGFGTYHWQQYREQKQVIVAPAIAKSSRSEIPLTNAPLATWPKLTIPPKGKSERISVPPGMHAVMKGNAFLLHNVLLDGTECAFGEVSCVNGPVIMGVYVTNEANVANEVYYAFEAN